MRPRRIGSTRSRDALVAEDEIPLAVGGKTHLLHALPYRGQALAAADAHSLQRIPALAAGELAREGGEDAGAGGADRVAERDAGAVHVEALAVRLAEVSFASRGSSRPAPTTSLA